MTEQKVEELIQKYAAGTANEEEVQQLMDWYRSSPIEAVPWHINHPEEPQQMYHRMRQRLQKDIPKRDSVFQLSWLKIAALFILVMGATFFGLYVFTASPSYTTVSNPAGKIQLVQLPDNSKVWLNASSTLRYAKDFTDERSIELEGEAYFEVTHDAAHPFKIQTGSIKTTVLGTTFNIKAYPKEANINISVVSGRVGVANNSSELAVLTPAMQLAYNRETKKSQTMRIDTSAITAWKSGKLLFDDEPFSEIAKTLERWYGVEIIFSNWAIGNCRYYMSFDANTPLFQLLNTMAEITETKYTIDKKRIILSGKPCR